MYRYKIAHFQNIVNQQPVNPQINSQSYSEQQPRRTPIRSGLVTAGLGLTSAGLLTAGNFYIKRGWRFAQNVNNLAGHIIENNIKYSPSPYTQAELQEILSARNKGMMKGLGIAAGGLGLGLGGLYLAGKTARRIIRGIRNTNNQPSVENNQYNQASYYNQPIQ